MPSLDDVAIFRLGFFVGVLLLMALWEALAPRRRLQVSRPVRWASNLGLVVLDSLIVRLLVPLGAFGTALMAAERGWGLLNIVTVPSGVAVVVAVVALDLTIYLQHMTFHAVPLLWRLHMVHHADLDFDVTTGVRFHTIEILLSMVIKMVAVVLLGAPPWAVVCFEVLLNASSMFSHGNVRIPTWLNNALGWVVVTSEMHRVHHSVRREETNSNYGFNLPWWDYLFGTYRAQPVDGHEGMNIGLPQFRDAWVDHLHWMLALPFLGKVDDTPGTLGVGAIPDPGAADGSSDPPSTKSESEP